MIHQTHNMTREKVPAGFGNFSMVQLCSECRARDIEDLERPCAGSAHSLSENRLGLARQRSAKRSEVV